MNNTKVVGITEYIRQNPFDIQYITDPSYETCVSAITSTIPSLISPANAIYYIKDQTPELCKMAITIEPTAIQFIKYQTHELCILAVSNNGLTLKYIDNKTYDVCRAAILSDFNALQYISEPSHELCELAISISWKAIRHISREYQEKYSDLLEKSCLIKPKSIKYICNPNEAMVMILLKSKFRQPPINMPGDKLIAILSKPDNVHHIVNNKWRVC